MKIKINLRLLNIAVLAIACNSTSQTNAQQEAKKTAENIEKTMNANKPNMVATSAGTYYMKATIDGKPWEAVYMYPTDNPKGAGRIIGEKGEYLEKGGISISIPVKPVRRWVEPGNKYEFNSGRAVDFSMDEDIFGGYTGELIITKVDDKWVEGTFYFTATSTSVPGKHEITNGLFRVAITKEN